MARRLIRYVGIDFGTSASVIAYKDFYEDAGDPKSRMPVERSDANVVQVMAASVIPTVMFPVGDGGYLFGRDAESLGEDAKSLGKDEPRRARTHFKMDLLRTEDAAVWADAKTLTYKFFEYLFDAYLEGTVQLQGAEVDEERTIVSFPAKWPAAIRDVTVAAADQAGFQNVTGMEEPVAAMTYFSAVRTAAYDKLRRRQVIRDGVPLKLLLIDMGAGTTDLVLVEYTPGGDEHVQLGVWPPVEKASSESTFGGGDLDELIYNRLIHPAIEGSLADYTDTGEAWAASLLAATRKWKESKLSPNLAAKFTVDRFPPDAYEHIRGSPGSLGLDRAWLERDYGDYIRGFSALVSGLLEHVRGLGRISSGKDVDLVVLTGGHSQWYWVRDLVTGRLDGFPSPDLPLIAREPERVLTGPHPQETVARGMALSGMPFRVTKVAANNAWISLTLAGTEIFAESTHLRMQIQSTGTVLPHRSELYRSGIKFAFPKVFKGQIPGECVLTVGDKTFPPLKFSFPYADFWARLGNAGDFYFTLGKDRDWLYLYLEVNVDEDEHFKGLGVVDAAWGKGYGFFPINRSYPNQRERKRLEQAYEARKK